jgi:hypothetical protein
MNNEYVNAYARGYTDAQRGRRYQDGCSPPHNLMLVIPGCKYSRLDQAAYRDGWFDGKASDLT